MIEILLPFYGSPDLFRLAVQGVLAQDDPDWRLLVVDDCYPGPSIEPWLSGLADDRISFRRNEVNLGVAGNFRHCLELATADHVVFLGCDDVMHPGYVRSVRATIARHPGAVVVQPRVQVVDGDGNPTSTLVDSVKARLAPSPGAEVVLSGEGLATSLLRGNWMYFPAITWRREVIAALQFRADMETALDLDLLLKLVGNGHEFVITDDLEFSYRRHRSSVSSVSAREVSRFAEEAQVYAEAAARYDAQGWTRAAREARRHLTSRLHAAALVPGAVKARDSAAARGLLRHALARS